MQDAGSIQSHSISHLMPGSHVHFLGICGTAMASLAGLLKDRGFKVTGSDQNPYPPMSTQIENLGIPLYKGYSKGHLRENPDFVIIGNVISQGNEEAEEVMRRGIPFTSLPKAMGELIIEDRESIVIAGTHGKTTTTSMMAWVAEQMGVKPGFLIGGIPKNFSRSFQNPHGNFFVIEGDEYDTAFFDKVPKFVHYRPKHVIFTSCEFDHADIYRDFDHVKSAFQSLMKLIPPGGSLHYWADDANVAALATEADCQQNRGYGLRTGDLRAESIVTEARGTRFSVTNVKDGKNWGEFFIAMSGEYNVLNALAVLGVSQHLGWNLGKVRTALENFQGVKRRQEVLGEPGGVLLVEDFAHHPTAVRETLKGLRARYPQRRLWAVFEPRSATSRRKVFQKDYVESFKLADQVCLAKAFDQSKIDEGNRFSSEELVADLKSSGHAAEAYDSADAIVTAIQAGARSGDLVVIMSNGGFDGIYGKLIKALGGVAETPRATV